MLHKGYTDGIPEQLSFVERYKSRLKLYTLLWTPQSASTHSLFYQDWHPVVRESVLPRTLKIVRVRKQLGRGRLRFHLIGGGSVEVKLGDQLDRSMHPCVLCSFNFRRQGLTFRNSKWLHLGLFWYRFYVKVKPPVLSVCSISRTTLDNFNSLRNLGGNVEWKIRCRKIFGNGTKTKVISIIKQGN